MVEYLELTIDELLLDQDNPRLGSVHSQSEALQEIIHLNESHFRNLMISIKDNGLDPGDSLYVLESDSDFIVLEGNRRLSALLVLSNPNLLNGTEIPDTIKKSLARVTVGFEKDRVEPIRCVLFEGRDDANEWILRRHTGSADGEGRIQWGPLEIQRFSGDRSVLDIIDFVGRNADYTGEEWSATKSLIESKKSSNVARLLESAAGKKHIGISTSNNNSEKIPMLYSDPAWALNVLRRIIEDVRDGIVDSRNLNKSSDIENYFSTLPKEFQRPKGVDSTPKAFRDIDLKPQPSPQPNSTPPKKKTKPTPKPRKSLAPKRHVFGEPNSTKGQTILREAATIDADKFTLSAAFLLRGFLELSIDDYMSSNRIDKSEKKPDGRTVDLDLSQKAERVVQHLSKSGKFKSADLRGIRNLIIDRKSSTSIQSLNGFIHNQFQIPTADSLRNGWDASIPLFIGAYGSP